MILNGKVLTMDAKASRVDEVALLGKVILALGSTDEMRALAALDAQVIDAGGKTVLPGFIDSHVHLFQGSASLDFLALGEVKGRAALSRTAPWPSLRPISTPSGPIPGS